MHRPPMQELRGNVQDPEERGQMTFREQIEEILHSAYDADHEYYYEEDARAQILAAVTAMMEDVIGKDTFGSIEDEDGVSHRYPHFHENKLRKQQRAKMKKLVG